MTLQKKQELIKLFTELQGKGNLPMLDNGQRMLNELTNAMDLIITSEVPGAVLGQNKLYLPKHSQEEQITLSSRGWFSISNILYNLEITKPADPKKRLECAGQLQDTVAEEYTKYLKEPNIITLMLKLDAGIDGATCLKNLFCDEFSKQLLLLNMVPSEPGNETAYAKVSKGILYLQFCTRLGENFCSLLYGGTILKKLPTILYKKNIKIPKTAIEYISDLVSENYFSTDDKIKLTKKHIKLFKYHFPKYAKTSFVTKDLKIFINFITLTVLQQLLLYKKKEVNENIKQFTSILLDIQKALNLSSKSKVRYWVKEKLELIMITVGNELLQALKDTVITIGEHPYARKKGKPDKTKYVTLINPDFILYVPHMLPSIDTAKVAIEPEPYSPFAVSFKRSEYSSIQSNYHMTGTMSPEVKELYDKHKNATRFTVNYQFLNRFLEDLIRNLQEWPIYAKANAKGSDGIYYSGCLAFFSELFEIDFYKLLNASLNNDHLYRIIESLFQYAVDFKNFKPFRFPDADYKEFKNTIKENYQMYKRIKNKIYSRKLLISQALSALYVIVHFDFFIYEWFLDARGRKYMHSILSLQSIPLLKAAIGFYNTTNINEYVKDHYNDPEIIAEYKSRNLYKEFVTRRTHTNYQNALKALTTSEEFSMVDNVSFFNMPRFCDVSKRFLFLALWLDYQEFKKDHHNHRFITPLGQDAVTSGLQMLSMFLHSKPLAKHAALCGEGNADGHTAAVTVIKRKINAFRDLANKQNLTMESAIETINTMNLPKTQKFRFTGLDYDELMKKLKKTVDIFDSSIVDLLLVRKNLKVLSMLLPYSISATGAKKQLLDKVLDSAILNGMWISGEIINKVNALSPYIYDLYIQWYKEELPDALLFPKAIKRFCREGKWNTFSLDTIYIKTIFHPHTVSSRRYTVSTSNKKATQRLTVVKNDYVKKDYKQLRRSFPANTMHLKDALVVLKAHMGVREYNELYEFLMHFYSNHDCFYTTPLFATELWTIVANAYKFVFNLNILNLFKKQKKFYAYILENRQKGDLLRIKDIASNTKFIKC